jgi:hypothetical protein
MRRGRSEVLINCGAASTTFTTPSETYSSRPGWAHGIFHDFWSAHPILGGPPSKVGMNLPVEDMARYKILLHRPRRDEPRWST